jgi:hypothetical protein
VRACTALLSRSFLERRSAHCSAMGEPSIPACLCNLTERLPDCCACHFATSQDAARERMRLRAEIAADKEARKVCPCILTNQQCSCCLCQRSWLCDSLALCVPSVSMCSNQCCTGVACVM